MKALIIDTDEQVCSWAREVLEKNGCDVVTEPDKNKIFDHKPLYEFSAILIDLTSQVNAIRYVIDLKARTEVFPYIVFMDPIKNEKHTLKAGANALLRKPLTEHSLIQAVERGERFKNLSLKLAFPYKKFPYYKGIISNDAMNELFMSCLDRTARYIESAAFVLFELKNSEQIYNDYGPEMEAAAYKWMAQNIIRLRRQSDIMAQIDMNQFLLLIQRPTHRGEPIDAAKRFRNNFQERQTSNLPLIDGEPLKLGIKVSVIQLPQTLKLFDETVFLPSTFDG